MKILLDTHIALWALTDTTKLSDEVVAMLEASSNEVYYSTVSVWEIAIKHKLKPKQMPMTEEVFACFEDKVLFCRIYSVTALCPIKCGKTKLPTR